MCKKIFEKLEEKFINWLFEPKKNLPIPYFIMTIVLVVCVGCVCSSLGKTYIYGPEWERVVRKEEEKVIYETDMRLKSGEMTVRTQLEFKYDNEIFYILEIQGLYDINQAYINNLSNDQEDSGDEQGNAKFCLAVETEQRERLDVFERNLKEVLKAFLMQEYEYSFDVQKFEVNEREIAKINYQRMGMNGGLPMYVSASNGEIRTIIEEEVIMRSPDSAINLDEINMEESLYTNENVMGMTKVCLKRIHVN